MQRRGNVSGAPNGSVATHTKHILPTNTVEKTVIAKVGFDNVLTTRRRSNSNKALCHKPSKPRIPYPESRIPYRGVSVSRPEIKARNQGPKPARIYRMN